MILRVLQCALFICAVYLLLAATREAAYVHALSLAAIAHSVAKVCAFGDPSTCSCNGEDLSLPPRDGVSRNDLSCSDNISFGITFATNFLRKRHLHHDGMGLTEHIELHNMQIGAQVYNIMLLSVCVYMRVCHIVLLPVWAWSHVCFSLHAFPSVGHYRKPQLLGCWNA